MIHARSRITAAAFFLPFLHLPSVALSSQNPNACVVPKDLTYRADTIGLMPGVGMSKRMVDKAIKLWESCDNYQVNFPSLLNGEPGSRTIYIDYIPSSSRDRRCGVFRGNRITLYRSALTRSGRPTICGSQWQNLAHELGHVLGLRDLGSRPGCSRHIMASINSANLLSRRPKPSECRAVGERWRTVAEIGPPNRDEISLGTPGAEPRARHSADDDR